ncbi:MAG: Gfo/Idh/MocA family oxidoreductase, partial [Planctomycetes bacterium]|nr:Gfo/Idh/MocA family oxidoreductase [Planctomycetota bacterium]
MEKITRRSFIRRSTTIAAGVSVAAALPSLTWARPVGANNDIRVAVVGLGGKGRDHVNVFKKIKGVRVVALCDPDRKRMQKAAAELGDQKVDKYVDYRKLLEDKDIDAVCTATCNHWHALVTVWGCEAGKDIYVEKPVCHTIWEGQQMIKAARKHNRIVQSGMQLRSDRGVREAFQWLNEGNLGKMLLSRGLCYESRSSMGKVDKSTPIPDYIDYDLWCGPSPHVPLMRRQLHFHWHFIWNTGNGDLGNQGIHQMDMCRRANGQDKLPARVISVGGRFGWND